jgi:hypothetical protein
VPTLSRPPCAAGGISVNPIEGPELALCDWQLFGAMQKTLSSGRCKKTGTNSRSCMCPHNRLPDARGGRRPAECLDRNLTALSPGVHLQRGPTSGMIILVAYDNALNPCQFSRNGSVRTHVNSLETSMRLLLVLCCVSCARQPRRYKQRETAK